MEVDSAFHSYIRPVAHPQLTPFCVQLTGIIQVLEYDLLTFFMLSIILFLELRSQTWFAIEKQVYNRGIIDLNMGSSCDYHNFNT